MPLVFGRRLYFGRSDTDFLFMRISPPMRKTAGSRSVASGTGGWRHPQRSQRPRSGINAICAITGLRPGHIHEVPQLDRFQSLVIEEAVALMRAKGITLPDTDPSAAIKEYCSHKFHRPSMMQHLDRGQRTEIDSLNGYVARESARLGLSAPYNAGLTMLIKGREHRHDC